MTVTLLVPGASVTVPVDWSTAPDVDDAMFLTNRGSSKRTGPAAGWPVSANVIALAFEVITRLIRLPSSVGKFATLRRRCPPSHTGGTRGRR